MIPLLWFSIKYNHCCKHSSRITDVTLHLRILDDVTMDSGVSSVSIIFATEWFINFGDGDVVTDSGIHITSSLAIKWIMCL